MITIHAATRLSDPEVLARTLRLATEGRNAVADLIALLIAVDTRKLWAEEGCSSIFRFCVQRLRLSEEEAYYRIATGRVAARFPVVLDRLREGRLTLTAVAVLRKHLTEGNHAALLQAAEGKSKREVQVLVAALAPRPDLPASLRKLPAPRSAAARATIASNEAFSTVADPQLPSGRSLACPADRDGPRPPILGDPLATADSLFVSAAAASEFGAPGEKRRDDATVVMRPSPTSSPERAVRPADTSGTATITPLAPARYSLRVTISEETCQKLRHAQDLLGHRVAPGDTAAVLDRALTLLVTELERQKFAALAPRRPASARVDTARRAPSARRRKPVPTDQTGDAVASPPELTATAVPAAPNATSITPSPPARSRRSRYIPAAVRREVWLRDQGMCQFRSGEGHERCGATAGLEFHHKVPFADRGETTAANLELRCVAHQATEARRWFGEDVTTYRAPRPATAREAPVRSGLAQAKSCRCSVTESG